MSDYSKGIIATLKDMIDYGWGFSDYEESPSIAACEYSISAIEKLDKIKGILDRYNNAAGLEEYMYLKEINEVLEHE